MEVLELRPDWPKEGLSRSIMALMRKVSWQPDAKKYHKVTLWNKPHTKDILGGKSPEGWLLLLRWEATENWAEDRIYIGFLGSEDYWDFKLWAWTFYSGGWSLAACLWREGTWPLKPLECLIHGVSWLEVLRGGSCTLSSQGACNINHTSNVQEYWSWQRNVSW